MTDAMPVAAPMSLGSSRNSVLRAPEAGLGWEGGKEKVGQEGVLKTREN